MANPENKQIPYESTQKDIRDAIESVATAIGGIAVPSADHVSYDNSVSGLSATDVQDAIDELASEKVDKEVGKGLSTNDYTTAEKTKLAGIEAGAEVNPTSSAKTATESFETVDGGLLSKCQINLVPVQSGSGDPYPAGGGKNKFDGTSIIQANIQSNGTISNASVNNRIIYCKCSPSTTYTISKTVGTAFRVACYSSEPTNGSTSIGTVTTDNTASSITITTDASATYIGAWVWNSADSLTADQMLATCQIELGNQATPYAPPSNVRPISGHTEVDLKVVGKNYLKCVATSQTISGVTLKVNSDGTISCSGNASATVTLIVNGDVLPAGSYILNGCPSGGGSNKYKLDVPNAGYLPDYGNGVTFTADGTTSYGARIVIYSGYGDGLVFKPMFRKSTETDSTFEPYLGHLYQVQIGSTVYGGYVDLVSGVMTVDRGYLDASSVTWVAQTNSRWFYNGLTSVIKLPPNNATPTESISDRFVAMSNDNMASTTNIGLSVNNSGSLIIRNGSTTIQPEGQVVYPLATPLTIHLTPQQIETLAGQNNLSTPLSGQSIEANGVEYKELFTFADVKEIVDLRVPISMLGTDESGNTTASRAYTTGEFFYMDGKMYKVLTSIASGATFTVGTNISETTLFAELTALA